MEKQDRKMAGGLGFEPSNHVRRHRLKSGKTGSNLSRTGTTFTRSRGTSRGMVLLALLMLGGCVDQTHSALDDIKNTRQNTRYKEAGDE